MTNKEPENCKIASWKSLRNLEKTNQKNWEGLWAFSHSHHLHQSDNGIPQHLPPSVQKPFQTSPPHPTSYTLSPIYLEYQDNTFLPEIPSSHTHVLNVSNLTREDFTYLTALRTLEIDSLRSFNPSCTISFNICAQHLRNLHDNMLLFLSFTLLLKKSIALSLELALSTVSL